MPFEREPIFHDRQDATSIVPQSFSTAGFNDIVGATLTAKDLGSSSNYDIDFFPFVNVSSANTTIILRSLVNGQVSGDDREFLVKTSGFDISLPTVGFLPNVNAGDIIQIQISRDKGTAIVTQFTLQVDGIPEIRVIE